MLNQDNIDLNIILSFSNHYEKLFEKGEITETQLDQILSLIDDYEKYSSEEFEKKVNEIFE